MIKFDGFKPESPDVEALISRQQKIAEKLERQGHPRAARQAREMLALFVKSHFLIQDHRFTTEEQARPPRTEHP